METFYVILCAIVLILVGGGFFGKLYICSIIEGSSVRAGWAKYSLVKKFNRYHRFDNLSKELLDKRMEIIH